MSSRTQQGDREARSIGVMAAGTVVSRATGFLRLMVLAAALGVGGRHGQLADAYNVGNLLPNIIYELLLGGVLTSIFVPLLVRSARDDADDGAAFAQALMTMVVVVLTALTLLSILGAPLLLRLYSHGAPSAREVLFARLFLPQIPFYGVGAAAGALLNTRGRFGPPMFAPVLNNVVVIATAFTFIAVSHNHGLDEQAVSAGEIALLAIGTTLGVATMTVALWPSLRATGFRWRWRFDLSHPQMRSVATLGSWVLLYVASNQIGFAVVVRLARAASNRYTSYDYAFQIFQLPYAIVSVSVISVLLPRMSRHADAGRLVQLREDLDRGLRMTLSLIVPAAIAYLVLARPIAIAVFARGRTTEADAVLLGHILMGFSVGLGFFAAFQLQLRTFYAMHDSRTPALVNIAVNASMVIVDLTLFTLLKGNARLVGLAVGYASSYAVGLTLTTAILRRRLAESGDKTNRRLLVRVLIAALLAALPTYAVSRALHAWAGSASAGSTLTAVAGCVVMALAYLTLAHRMQVTELRDLTQVLTFKFRR